MLSTIITYVMVFLTCSTLAVLLIWNLDVNIRTMIFITIVTIYFPINIPFVGRDAMTTSGVFILILYIVYLLDRIKNGGTVIEKYDYLVYLLILFGAFSNIIAFDQGYITLEDVGPVMRQYFSFVTSLLFFIVVKNSIPGSKADDGSATAATIERCFALFLILTASHVVISIINKYIPSTVELAKIFYVKEGDPLEDQSRITGFVFSYENYAEILAALCPLAIYKLVSTNNRAWNICLAIFACGVLLSVTRSGILLFACGLSLSLFYQFRKRVLYAVAYSSLLLGMVLAFVSFYPETLNEVAGRFSLAEDAYSAGGTIFDTINRGNFPDIWDFVISNLTLSGHSMLRVDYHNVFLTTLHQMGVIGSLLFFAVLLYPLILLAKSFFGRKRSLKALTFACLLFMSLFIINETKVEFTRTSGYEQICWGLFALCYLVSKHEPKQRDCRS